MKAGNAAALMVAGLLVLFLLGTYVSVRIERAATASVVAEGGEAVEVPKAILPEPEPDPMKRFCVESGDERFEVRAENFFFESSSSWAYRSNGCVRFQVDQRVMARYCAESGPLVVQECED